MSDTILLSPVERAEERSARMRFWAMWPVSEAWAMWQWLMAREARDSLRTMARELGFSVERKEGA